MWDPVSRYTLCDIAAHESVNMHKLLVLPILLAFSSPSRAADEFPIPEGLEGRVWFWEQVFGSYDSDQALLHDREHPHLLWQVIDLPTHENESRERQLGKNAVNAALASLRARLNRLAAKGAPKDELDEKLLALVGGKHRELVGAAGRLRSQRGVADKFRAGLKRAKKHRAVIENTLDAEGVPKELAALPFIESMYTPTAKSHAGAAGLWQLMPATARELGLKVTAARDDRMNIAKATRGAARMLKDNYRMLKSWPLAITGYNHGPYGVKKATQQMGTTDLVQLIKRYKKSTWGFASKNFYAEFIAASRLYTRLGGVTSDDDELARGAP